jgi:hypothetical protein
MDEVLVVLSPKKGRSGRNAQSKVTKKLESCGAVIRQRYGPNVLILEAAPDVIESLSSDHAVAGVYRGQVPPETTKHLDETGQMGVAAWNQRHSDTFQRGKQDREGEGLAWDHPSFQPEGRPDE